MSKVYRWCIVYHCKNTSIKNPTKCFIQVPLDKRLRRLWIEAAGRNPKAFSSTTTMFVCEDHFDLPNDMENYQKWKMMGGYKLIKKNVIPHKCLLITVTEGREWELKMPRYDASKDTSNEEIVVKVDPEVRYINEATSADNSSATADVTSTASTSMLVPPTCISRSNGKYLDDGKDVAELALKLTIRNININPKRYLGIAKDSLWLISEIQKHTGLDNISVCIALKKIKTAHTFGQLADDFGISESTTLRIFRKAVPLISPLLKELIVWPSSHSIQNQLPEAFRESYGKIESIIHCFEIKIIKPSDSVQQALTWSKYKKTHTLKYLISATPDGIINFISKGYGGQTTNHSIVEDCGYLDALRPGTVVMGGRGFENIDILLYSKKCSFVCFPSGDKLSTNTVIETKHIASLKTYIQRVIGRLKTYKFLNPHGCIHSKLIPLTDHIVYIACGLTNLEEPLIK